MATKKIRDNLKPPFLKRICFEKDKTNNQDSFPFSIPIFQKDFILELSKPITIFVLEDSEHFRVMSKFYKNPASFIKESLNQDEICESTE